MAKTPSQAEQRELGWQVDYNVDEFTYCCGGREVGGLSCYQRNVWYQSTWRAQREWTKNTHLSPSIEEAWTVALKNIREHYAHFPLMFNLTNGLEELRDMLSKEPDATLIHTWRNPNTHNVIEMWILTNGSDEGYHGDGDDD